MQEPDIHVALVKIPVSNFPAAREFYNNVLGLKEEFAVEEFGWAQYQTKSIPIAIYTQGKGGGSGTPGGETGIHLSAPNLEEMATTLNSRGHNSVGELSAGADGTIYLCVSDPDGNVIKILQSPR